MSEHDDPRIEIEAFGPGQETTEEVSRAVLEHPLVREELGRARHRLLSVRFLEPAAEKPRGPAPPDRYRAAIYDYTNNRVVLATGSLDDVRGSLEVSEAGHQPLPTRQEFDEAVEVLLEDGDLGPAIRGRRLEPYRPMPPLIEAELPDGRVERTLAVGLLPRERGARHEIVGANMVRRTAARFAEGAPERSRARAETCGLPNANQAATPRGLAGQFQVSIPAAGGGPLWDFLVIRPSASSGTNASGIELQNVRYRGKLVLFQAHAPILNVQYDGDACGPFRDWLFEESWIQADGTNVAPGIRRSQTPARTILESGTDSGNFRGVALYRQGQADGPRERVAGRVVPVRQPVALPRRRDDPPALRVLGRGGLVRLQRPPPPRLLEVRLRHRHRREQRGPRVQRPAHLPAGQLAHDSVRGQAPPEARPRPQVADQELRRPATPTT